LGIAYAAGPNYNYPWELQDPAGKAAALARCYDSARAAIALAGGVAAPERALIEALPARFPQPEPLKTSAPGTTPPPMRCASRIGRIPTTWISAASSWKPSSIARPGVCRMCALARPRLAPEPLKHARFSRRPSAIYQGQ
jgi:hypothetical protein